MLSINSLLTFLYVQDFNCLRSEVFLHVCFQGGGVYIMTIFSYSLVIPGNHWNGLGDSSCYKEALFLQ